MKAAALRSVYPPNIGAHPVHARISGLDGLRFIAACWVMISHLGLAPADTSLHATLRPMLLLFNGGAAVILFFVISGFCIHYPYRNSGRLGWQALLSYYARRYIRILIPMAAAAYLSDLIGPGHWPWRLLILWSLVAEMIYYLIYPALLVVKNKWGWKPLFAVSITGSLAVYLSDTQSQTYHNNGESLTWILGLPCWLAGAWVADKIDLLRSQPVARKTVFLWRIAIWIGSSVLLFLNFHTPIRCTLTLSVFSIAVAFWLSTEIRYGFSNPFPAWLEKAGAFSYSLYLIHLSTSHYAQSLFPTQPFTGFACQYLFAGAGTVVFYYLVESPAQWLAKKTGKLLMPESKTSPAP